jgi:hypothetical protein
MKILHVQGLYLHMPYLLTVARWALDVDLVAIAGNSMPVASYTSKLDNERLLRNWLASLGQPIAYSRGGHDADVPSWGLKNVLCGGTHEIAGLAIHVIDTISADAPAPRASTLPGIVVTHFPPSGSLCAIETPSCEECGRADVLHASRNLGDVRCVLAGRVSQPRARVDWIGLADDGALVVSPGLSYHEHRDEPAHALIDTDRRTAQIYDGVRTVTHSFAR